MCVGKTVFSTAFFLFISLITVLPAAADPLPSCAVAATPTLLVAAEGLTELTAPITLTCTGGTSGQAVSSDVFVTLNTNITNRPDINGAPSNVTVTADTGSGPVLLPVTPQFSGASTIYVNRVSYVVPTPSTQAVVLQISGLRAAIANVTGGTSTASVTALVQNTAFTFVNSAGVTVTPATSAGPSLLTSVLSYPLPCTGSSLPTGQFGFQDLLTAGTSVSTVRVTEATSSAFRAATQGADTGNRIVVNMSGYPAGVRIFVPDVIVGNNGSAPTSAGAFGSTPSGGTFTSGFNQLLLNRVTGADKNGAGGTVTGAPNGLESFNTVTEITLTGGAGYAVYEVVSSDVTVTETAQIPVFVAGAANLCASSGSATLAPVLGPVSNVSVSTPTDPIPRFVAETPGPDCKIFDDCDSLSFPTLAVDKTSITLSANSQGNTTSAALNITNSGSGNLLYTIITTYQTTSGQSLPGWLTLSQSSGENGATVALTADPSQLSQGTYQATVSINAGTYGIVNVPVTFNVGPVGVTIKAIVSAASYQAVPLAPGSYAALFGTNLGGQNVSISLAGVTCTACISYAGATQVNFIIPQQAVSGVIFGGHVNVVLTVDGMQSNTFEMPVALNSPGVFNPGIENVAGSLTVNSATQPAVQNQYIAIFMTGLQLPIAGAVTVSTGNQTGLIPQYDDQAPGLPGLEQVNVWVPAGLSPVNGAVPLSVCLTQTGGQQLCSPPVSLYIK